jgi:hypothetical protein
MVGMTDPLLVSVVADALDTPEMTARLDAMIDRAIADIADRLGITPTEAFARVTRGLA